MDRPQGLPDMACFALCESELPPPGANDLLVENTWLSVDPYMRGRMGAQPGYAPYELNEPMDGRAVGRVLESRSERFAPGDLVAHPLGWRNLAVVPASEAMKLRPELPAQTYLGVLGMPGATAYFGLLCVAAMREGDTVFVSGAAGGVGSTVVQLARCKGAGRIIGSASGPTKTAWLSELGCDAVIDYRPEADLTAALRRHAPEGVDVYFDNVGGAHLFAALSCARPHARFAECGMIGGYNDDPMVAARNLMEIVVQRVRVQGFAVADFAARFGEFYREMTPLVAQGRVKQRETVAQGLEAAPAAFLGLFSGENLGKMLVRL